MTKNGLISAEQVSRYHPDKYADQISDSIVGLALSKNPYARCAVETLVKNNIVIIAGELGGVELNGSDIARAVNKVALSLGYIVDDIINLLDTQSKEISDAVDKKSGKTGAGDQGVMSGYATRETDSYLDFGFDLTNKIIMIIEDAVIKDKILLGDAKTQVITDSYNNIVNVYVSVCYIETESLTSIKKYVKQLIKHLVPVDKIIVNPAGKWNIGGAAADSGLTGRKIVCDQYGSLVAVGGGAFSGKDLSKVDRSVAYALRNIAIDAIKFFNELEHVFIQVGYIIGEINPSSILIATGDDILNIKVSRWLNDNYDLSPDALIKRLDIKPEDYIKLAANNPFRNGYVGNWK